MPFTDQPSSVSPTSSQGRRVALVIGNSTYQNAPELKNPKNDVTAMDKKRRELGFEVIGGANEGIDLGFGALHDLLLTFSRKFREGTEVATAEVVPVVRTVFPLR